MDCDGNAIHAHVGLECRACGDEFSVWCRDGSPYDMEGKRPMTQHTAESFGYDDLDDWWDFCSAACAKVGRKEPDDDDARDRAIESGIAREEGGEG